MGSLGKLAIAFLMSIVLVVVISGGCFYSGYNKAIALDESVNSSWAQVENQLQRRFDLIPNLVETVKGLAGQEEKIFLGVAEARKAYTGAQSVPQKAKAASMFESALSRLLVIQERYPELKSNQSFMKLQDQIEGTENRLSVERKRYNDTVSALNTFSRKLLGRLYCSFAGVEKAEYFKVAEEAKDAPKVDFGGGKDGG
jgi:LemA protein